VVESGFLNVNGGPTFINSGSVTLGGGASLSRSTGTYVQTAGSTTLANGSSLFVPPGVTIQGGSLSGSGTVTGPVTNSGTVRPGSPLGILTFTAPYTQTAAGTLAIELGGLTPGVGYDRLVEFTSVNLNGTFAVSAVNGFLPNFGDTFVVMTFGSRVGDFASYTGLDLGTYRLLVPSFTPTSLVLTTVSSNHAPELDPIADQTVDEGGTVSFTATASSFETSETMTYSLDPGAPAGASIDPVTGEFTFTPDDGPASYTITVRVTDNGLPPLSDTQTVTITVDNVDPTPAIGGAPANSPEATEISLTASATDPSAADTAEGFTFAWSVTKDGDAYASGSGAGFSFTPDDDGTYVVTLTATDKDGGVGSVEESITVDNVAPTATVSGASGGVRGQTRTFVLGATDPSAVDQAAGFTYSIDWGDGTVETVTGPSGTEVDHVYTANGSYTVSVTATDKDGGESAAATHAITIVTAQMQGDVLAVGGTTDADLIVFMQLFGGPVTAIVNGAILGPFEGVGRILAFGQDGNDLITVLATAPAEVYGGGGNDLIVGGSGADIIDGGAGNDLIEGGTGRDILIGGDGADLLEGFSGEDLLIAGTFMDGSRFADRQADLRSLQTGWTGSGVYADRVADLLPFLSARVADDGDSDILIGGGSMDWFVAQLDGPNADVVLGAGSSEIVTDLA
jgi:Ca2+-binding RTX toxin-like protein